MPRTKKWSVPRKLKEEAYSAKRRGGKVSSSEFYGLVIKYPTGYTEFWNRDGSFDGVDQEVRK